MHYYATALRPYRITANAIAPTLVESDLMNRMAPKTTGLPLGRPGRADEIWPALRMIIETEYLAGQTIHIDAGRLSDEKTIQWDNRHSMGQHCI
jgi:3-oxoacyl-[acyl-carrier protein] reductase